MGVIISNKERIPTQDLATHLTVAMLDGQMTETNCHRITFQIKYLPGRLFQSDERQGIDWKVIDKVFGVEQTVCAATSFFPGKGGSETITIEFPEPEDFSENFENEITVIIDPDRKILGAESNNQATIVGYCGLS